LKKNSDELKRRVRVQWSQPAKAKLATLPSKVRRAILDKTKALADSDPRDAHKPLTGSLRGYYSIKVIPFPRNNRADRLTRQSCLRHFEFVIALLPSIEMLGYSHFVPTGTKVADARINVGNSTIPILV